MTTRIAFSTAMTALGAPFMVVGLQRSLDMDARVMLNALFMVGVFAYASFVGIRAAARLRDLRAGTEREGWLDRRWK